MFRLQKLSEISEFRPLAIQLLRMTGDQRNLGYFVQSGHLSLAITREHAKTKETKRRSENEKGRELFEATRGRFPKPQREIEEVV